MPSTTETTVLSRRGQTQVPAWVREQLGLVAGQKLVWEVVGQDIRLHVVPYTEQGRQARWRGVARTRMGSSTDKTLSTFRAADRKTKKALGLKGE